MNDITKVATSSVQTKSVPVSPLPDSSRGQKTGNDLPVAAQAAKSQPQNIGAIEVTQEKVQAAVAQMNEYN